jgi:hypothetical protein
MTVACNVCTTVTQAARVGLLGAPALVIARPCGVRWVVSPGVESFRCRLVYFINDSPYKTIILNVV